MVTMQPTVSQVYDWLQEVKDPEIPALSLVDMGVITEVQVLPGEINIEMTPTFVGCPALDVMRTEVMAVLKQRGFDSVVEVNFKKPWSSDKLTARAREALKSFGLAPPPAGKVLVTDLDILEHVPCPRCNSTNTELRNPFGPTLCRSIHYCYNCLEAFEQFKPL
jgi:ring-1,2-phenylacetyl-CoA epoxidase subunit PaaD